MTLDSETMIDSGSHEAGVICTCPEYQFSCQG